MIDDRCVAFLYIAFFVFFSLYIYFRLDYTIETINS
jgi:hypothetical protein